MQNSNLADRNEKNNASKGAEMSLWEYKFKMTRLMR